MTDPESDTGRASLGSRLRERLGAVSPFSLGMLGFVGFLGDLFPALEVLQLFHFFWLFFLWPFAAMLVGALKQAVGADTAEAGPRDWLEIDVGWRGQVAFLLGLPLSVLNPLMGRQDVMQLLGSVVVIGRHRGSLPAPETHAQSVSYRLPVEGTWTVVNGSPIKEYSHSWFPATQRYAYDFVVTDEDGRTRPKGTDTSVENYYCYERPVVAPADGVVVDVRDGDPELGRGGGFSHPFKRSITGNAVTIRHAAGEYSSLVHLVPGSIGVEPGDRVERGQRVGRCGHSGNSSEPHLHFQLQDHPTFEVSAGLPVAFDDVSVDTPGMDVAAASEWTEPDGGTGRYVHVGQRVSHTDDGEPRSGDAPATGLGATAHRALGRVRALARSANGLAVGGFVTVVAGFVVQSLSTLALGLAGLAALALAWQVKQRFADGSRVRLGRFGLAGGLGAAAALVGALATSNGLPDVGSTTAGASLFLAGFALYVGVWEYGRWSLFRGERPSIGTVTDE